MWKLALACRSIVGLLILTSGTAFVQADAGPTLAAPGPTFTPPQVAPPPLTPRVAEPANANPAYSKALAQFAEQPSNAAQTGWQPVSPQQMPRGSQFSADPNASIEPLPDPQTDAALDTDSESTGLTQRVLDEPVFSSTDPAPGVCERPCFGACEEPWMWQLLPRGLIYRSYLAGRREPRLAFSSLNQTNFGDVWEATLGARVGILRYGTTNPIQPEGWEIDLEGASFSRLSPDIGPQDLIANDYRFGLPLTYGRGRWQFKLAYWHLSSHIGDEFLIRNPTFQRINYVRNEFVLGAAWTPALNLRLYAEIGWAYHTNGGAKPWDTQFGIEYRPGYATGLRGAPFLAVNAHFLEDNDWNGYFASQLGWAWRSGWGGQLLRVGVDYINGTATQFAFEGQWEQQIGFGIWYDF